MAEQEKPPTPPRADLDLRSKAGADALAHPSSYVNQYHVMVSGGLTRLTFGEAHVPGGVPVTWRSSVTLTTNQALDLANFIWDQYDADRQRRELERSLAPSPPDDKNG
ncbi:MAG: hypothetical protein JNJ73_00525 [Hyphomonadaceae bacterium]|nr:hypothetical protein [Hyphomonadaceae bacterium]